MYELLYIVGSPFTEKDLPKIEEKIKKIIEHLKGKIIDEQNLGNKKFAYPIKHNRRGFYVLLHFEISKDKLIKLDKQFRLTSEVLRHLIIRTKPRVHKSKTRVKPKKSPNKILIKEEKEEIKNPKKEEKKKEINIKNLGEKIDKLLKI